MGTSLLEAPLTRLSAMDIFSGTLPDKMAREAEELGPLIRWPMQSGPVAGGYIVFLMGAEANKLVFHTHREAFSHDVGWTPNHW